ncbi:hypothetical protein FHL15_006066 [Xylaria flabelliformis]|uniref:Uncharacterized protein n=1 Tax=Xylaria flabelliformis TaxID=2512241 RepID=A0A553HYA1_9PEZI|nr:hypothetical protein FHL15_006066 [Xylaria flabelliformis]
MPESWNLDSATAEEKELFEKEKEEARLKRESFNWLNHDNRGASYISYTQFSHLPATSFEFGADGFAGACNSGGELLHFSAPSNDHGLIFARGAFNSSLYACISRAQTEYGGSATFGLRIARDQVPYISSSRISNGPKLQTTNHSKQEQKFRPLDEKCKGSPEGSSFRLGGMIERGCFNYRWPLNEYSLLLNNPLQEKNHPDMEVGYCTRLSYFKDGFCYQVIRLEQRSPDTDNEDPYHLFPLDGQVVLEIGGYIYFQLLKNIAATSHEGDGSKTHIKNHSTTECLRVMDEGLNIGLEARVYQMSADGRHAMPLSLTPSQDQDIFELRQPTRPSQPSCSHFDSSKSTFSTYGNSASSVGNRGISDESPVPLVYRATAKLHKPSKETGGYGNRSETFIAAIRLIHGTDITVADKGPKIPSSEEMHEDIWIEPVRPISPLEMNSQATGVMWETILQWRDLHTDSMSEFTEISLMARCLEKILQVDLVPCFYGTENQALAVISNPFMRPTVSLRSLFWKVRFLTKIHHFLDGLEKDPNSRPSPKIPKGDEKRGDQQVELIDNNALAFFSEFDGYDRTQMLNIATSQCDRILDAIKRIVSFLVELLLPSELTTHLRPQCPKDQSEFYYITMTICEFRQQDLKESCVPPDNHNFGVADKRKIILLKWYHYGSLLSLADRGKLPSYWRSATMKKKVYCLSNAATMACTGSTDLKSQYSVDDEIVDRLSFLAHELGMEEFDATAETVTSASIHRVRGREFTKYLNPGISLLNGREYSLQETSGPWEIHALCHNSRVNVLTLESEREYVKATKDYRGHETREEEVIVYKNKVYQFLNSEATLIPCWERSPTKMRSGWLQSEAAAVHGSTLLDIHNRIPVIPKLSPKISPQIGPVVRQDVGHYRSPPAGFTMGTPDESYKGVLSTQLREMLMELKGTVVSPINWASFRPPLQYYPDSFVNSLEDTPHLFRPPVTNNVFIPATLTQFTQSPDCGFVRKDLEEVIDEVQKSLSIVDILVTQQILSSRKHKISRNTQLPDMRYYRLKAKTAHGREALLETFSGKLDLVRALFDSVSPFLQDSAPMLTSTLARRSVCTTPNFHGSVMANESIELPTKLRHKAVLPDNALVLSQSPVSFFVSSVVVTTNAFGDFSRCTVISETDDKDTKEERLEQVVAEKCNEIWQVFVHQPQTARCLVFFYVLGKLCTKLCKQYTNTVKVFESIFSFADAFLLKETDWTQDRSSLLQFQLISWSLDCLSKFQNSLKATITSILDAKRELFDQIHEVANLLPNFEPISDKLSGTLALRDSRVGLDQNAISLEQNNAIQALTYLTIGYLPLGLIAAIFAIPAEQNVVFQGMGKWWFIGAIFILSAVTYFVVAWLNLIVDFFKFPLAPKARRREDRPNLWRALSKIRQQPSPPKVTQAEGTRTAPETFGPGLPYHLLFPVNSKLASGAALTAVKFPKEPPQAPNDILQIVSFHQSLCRRVSDRLDDLIEFQIQPGDPYSWPRPNPGAKTWKQHVLLVKTGDDDAHLSLPVDFGPLRESGEALDMNRADVKEYSEDVIHATLHSAFRFLFNLLGREEERRPAILRAKVCARSNIVGRHNS